MTKRIRIRPATVTDFDAFTALRQFGLKESPANFGKTLDEKLAEPVEKAHERFSSNVTSPDKCIFLACADEELVGCSGLFRELSFRWNHVGVIWGVYVKPEYRGDGLGRALNSHLLSAAQRIPGIRHIELEYTLGNEAARRSYESLGFRSWGVRERSLKRTNGEGYDASVCMSLDLETPDDLKLETERLLLRRWTMEECDVAGIHTVWSDPEAMRWVGDGSISESTDYSRSKIRDDYLAHFSATPLGRFAVERKEDGKVLGQAALIAVPDQSEIEIGYQFARAYWGKGYATEAASCLVDYALKRLRLPRVIGVTKLGHIASQRVLVKSGMQQIADGEYRGKRVSKFEARREFRSAP